VVNDNIWDFFPPGPPGAECLEIGDDYTDVMFRFNTEDGISMGRMIAEKLLFGFVYSIRQQSFMHGKYAGHRCV